MSKLRFRPPVMINPLVVQMNATTFLPDLVHPGSSADPDRDLVLLPPVGVTRARTSQIRGHRHVTLKGGVYSVNANTQAAAISIEDSGNPADQVRHVHIEGVTIIHNVDATDHHDAIQINAPTAIVTIQNCRVIGITGRETPAADHGDIVQLVAGSGPRSCRALRIDKLTGTSNYQGLYLLRGANMGADLMDLSRIDLRYIDTNEDGVADPPIDGSVSYMAYIADGPPQTAPSGVLRDVWVSNTRAGQTVQGHAIWPTSTTPVGYASSTAAGLTTFPAFPGLKGGINHGRPPGGDFVPNGVSGHNYVSPGYISSQGRVPMISKGWKSGVLVAG